MGLPLIIADDSVTGTKRIEVLDILRGFALCGILFVNVLQTTLPYIHTGSATHQLTGTDAFVRFLYDLLIQTKFYTILAFVFGVSFYLFMNRLQARGIQPHRLYLRRLSIMLLFGLIHVTLIWYGDVLYIYALIGFFLLFFYRANSTFLFFLASFLLIVAMWPTHTFIPVVVRKAVEIFSLFLYGLWAGKLGLFEQLEKYESWLRFLQAGSLLVTIPLWFPIITHYGNTAHYLSADVKLWVELSGKPLAVFYISTLILLWQQGKMSRLLSRFRVMGRMALTNYIGQSLLFNVVLGNAFVALGLQLSYVQAALVCCLILIAQALASSWWLDHFRYGPLEWLWRAGTYGKVYKPGF